MKLLLFLLLQALTNAQFSVEDGDQRQFDLLLTGKWRKFENQWGEGEFLSRGVNIDEISKLVPPTNIFSGMIKEHVAGAKKILDAFTHQKSLDKFFELAARLRENVNINRKAWLAAVIKSTLFNPKLKNLKLQLSLPELMPDVMFAREDLQRAVNQALAEVNAIDAECVASDETVGTDNGDENMLWYFRQDVFANSHHYFWHVYYEYSDPIWRDRRGELFAFMHHEFLARYATERLTHKLPAVTVLPIVNGQPLIGYNSHLTDTNSNVSYTARLANTPLADLPIFNLTVAEIQAQRTLILEGIDAGYAVHSNGSLVDLRNAKGLDVLGDMVEANVNSVNPELYNVAGFHNVGHLFISSAMDPAGELQLPPGVMVFTATSFRDIVFYEFHLSVDEVFQHQLDQLEPYGPLTSEYPLVYNDVRIVSLEVKHVNEPSSVNELLTGWALQEFNLTHGLDWAMNENEELPPIQICSKHLSHVEFEYRIVIENFAAEPVETTVRIFLAPRFDINGERFSMEAQRRLFFSLDKFTTTLSPGVNNLTQSSLESTLTIPSNSWLDNLNSEIDYCGCGWPNHLLLPKGSPEGAVYDLFVIATNGVEDAVPEVDVPRNDTCLIAPLWCGVRDEKYPDSKPMGYPFDRRPYSVGNEVVANLDEYVNGIPNMKSIEVGRLVNISGSAGVANRLLNTNQNSCGITKTQPNVVANSVI